MTSTLVDKIRALSETMDAARIPHAFGGALALAYCVGEPRATADIDLNVFIESDEAGLALRPLSSLFPVEPVDEQLAVDSGQVRLFWDRTPIDLFFINHSFLRQASGRTQLVDIADFEIRVLGCVDLAVLKAYFNRPKDWVDIQEMVSSGLDHGALRAEIVRLTGKADQRLKRLNEIVVSTPEVAEPIFSKQVDPQGWTKKP